MGETGYYYSRDGSDTNGPVPKAALRRLFEDKVISSGSFLCEKGRSEWQPFHPEMIQAAPAPTRPRRKHKQSWFPDEKLLDPRFRRLLLALCFAITFGGATIGIHLRYVVFADAVQSADSPAEVLGYFVGYAALILAGPWLISRGFRQSRRLFILTICAAGFVPLVNWLLYDLFTTDMLSSRPRIQSITPSTSPVVVRQNVEKGYTTPDFSQIEKNLQAVRDATTHDKTDYSVVRQDLIPVIDTLMAKCKACDDATTSYPRFDPSTLTSVEDLANRLAALSTLRDAQGDLNTYVQNITSNCREALSHDDFSDTTLTEAIDSFHKSVQIDQMVALSNFAMKISDDETACLEFLSHNWGHWRVVNGVMNFETQAMLDAYNALLQTLQSDVNNQQDQINKEAL